MMQRPDVVMAGAGSMPADRHGQRDATGDPFIAAQWKTLQAFLEGAYQLTFFGYGAPSSDVEAVSLMKDAWGNIANRELEQTEIIDIRDEDELAELWSPFIHTHHYQVHASFGTTWLAKHPRRTCEAAWQQFMECQFLADNAFVVQRSSPVRPCCWQGWSRCQAWRLFVDQPSQTRGMILR